MNTIKLSIIIPILNEEQYIGELIDRLESLEPSNKEIFLVDGGSTDNTVSVIKNYTKTNDNFYLINNENQYASYAFNVAFEQTKGDYIAFIGAHAIYSENYFIQGIELLEKNVCDAVGGVLKQKGNNTLSDAIAYCMSCKFGVGDTEFRTSTEERFVQSVAFAIYKKEVFEKIGLMDTSLVRNQDDEFHYRMGSKGYKILMTPRMEATYYVRNSFKNLYKQYYEYGLYKPLVLKKISSGIRIRHLVPSVFVIYLCLILFVPDPVLSIPLWIYLLLDFFYSLKIKGIVKKIYALLIFPTLHISYGLGFIIGMFKI